jgi:hypothetical protein
VTSLISSKYRRGTSYSLVLPTLPSLALVPRRVDLFQKPYNHDVLVLEFSQVSIKWFELMKTGVPIKFEWSQGALVKSWLGYVSFVTKSVASQKEELMEVHCVGSTFPLKERATKVFENMSVPAAVKEIVTEFGFNFVGEDNNVLFEQLTIAGHSYWEWIHEYAKRIGYGIWVDNMNFYFRPLDKLIDQSLSDVAVLSMNNKNVPVGGDFLDRTLDSFKVLNGEHVEGLGVLRTNKLIGGVDPMTSKVVGASSSPKTLGEPMRQNVSDVIFSEVDSSKVASSEEHAQTLIDGSAQLARFNMPARVKCQGDPRIHPFSPVLIQGTGPLTDGFWIVNEVKHQFARIGDYQIELKATIDGTGIDVRTVRKDGAKSVSGVVNLTEALEQGFSGNKTLDARLSSNAPIRQESNQGFNRTPAVWWHSKVGGK